MRAAVNVIVIVALAVLVLVVVAGAFIVYTSSFKRGAQTQATAAECDKYCSLEQQWWAQAPAMEEPTHSDSDWCKANCHESYKCSVLYLGQQAELKCRGNDAALKVDCSDADCNMYGSDCMAVPYYHDCTRLCPTYAGFSNLPYCKCCCGCVT